MKHTGKFQGAVLACQRAIEIDKSNVMAYFNLGNTYQDLKKYDDAIISFEEVLRLDSHHMDATFNLAVAYQDRASITSSSRQQKKDLSDALRCYQIVCNGRPDITEARRALESLSKVLKQL